MEVLYGFIVGLILGFILTISIKYLIVSIKKLKNTNEDFKAHKNNPYPQILGC